MKGNFNGIVLLYFLALTTFITFCFISIMLFRQRKHLNFSILFSLLLVQYKHVETKFNLIKLLHETHEHSINCLHLRLFDMSRRNMEFVSLFIYLYIFMVRKVLIFFKQTKDNCCDFHSTAQLAIAPSINGTKQYRKLINRTRMRKMKVVFFCYC